MSLIAEGPHASTLATGQIADAGAMNGSHHVEHPERSLGPPARKKLKSWDLYRSMGSPRYIVAPMVDQSELAWRVLSRLHGADHAYTPMIHAGLFAKPANSKYQREQFDWVAGEEGNSILDRPVSVQFCANNRETFLVAAQLIADNAEVDAVDLNLGCPQGIAKRGGYGAFLMEDWPLIEGMIRHMHEQLSVPITAKFRVYDTLEKTLDYARMLERAGAQILTVHGRTRDQKGQLTGLADWEKIRAVKAAVSVPVFANGNILTHKDVQRCLEFTGVDGIMSAEGNLYNPAVFEPLNRDGAARYRASLPEDLIRLLDTIDANFLSPDPERNAYYPIPQMTRHYLAIVRSLKTPTGLSAVKAHLFRMWKPVFGANRHLDLRDALAKITNAAEGADAWKANLDKYDCLVEDLTRRLQIDFEAGVLPFDPSVPLPEDYADIDCHIPYSHCQPYLRPVSEADLASGKVAAPTTLGGLHKRDLQALQATEDVSLDERSLGDAAKRLKEDDARATTNVAAVKVLQRVLPCPVCNNNNASNRCIRKICRSCCLSASVSSGHMDGIVGECLAHALKIRQEQERKDAQKAHKQARNAKRSEQRAIKRGAPSHTTERDEMRVTAY